MVTSYGVDCGPGVGYMSRHGRSTVMLTTTQLGLVYSVHLNVWYVYMPVSLCHSRPGWRVHLYVYMVCVCVCVCVCMCLCM